MDKLSGAESFLSRPDPVNGQAVWTLPPGGKVRLHPHWLVLTIVLLVPMTLTGTLGSISFSSPDGTAIVSFWPAAAFQIVFSIWFGIYGALAGIIGPMLGNGLVGDSPFVFIPANAIQCCLVGLWFRYRKLDPRLRSRGDWFGLLVVGCVLGNMLGAVAGVTETYLRGVASGGPSYGLDFWVGKLFTWFSGNTVPSLFLAPALLKAASPMVVRDPAFCQSFWGGVEVPAGRGLRLRFSDLPMVGKLNVLVLVAGVLPLLVVAAWSVWNTVKAADHLAAETNRQAVEEIRNETERHELMLRLWAGELDGPALEEKDRQKLVEEWGSVPEAFKELEIAELARIEAEIPPTVWRTFPDRLVGFYRVGAEADGSGGELRGVFRLESTPDKVLTGLVVWRQGRSPMWEWVDVEAVLVCDREGNDLYRNAPPELEDWRPEQQRTYGGAGTVRHGGKTWHVAEAALPRLGWRFVTLTSAHSAQAASLANIPNPVAALISLAIFGSIISGSAVACRIGRRVLAMAELVRESGAQPGKLHLPVTGRDELGYLAETLNQMSDELAVSVRRLQETTSEKERLAAEMELARQVQMSILPADPPEIVGYELAATSLPAREVGGDFFDFFVRNDGRLVMMIGDAVGKGLRAAMFIMETHALAHAAAWDRATPEQILTAVNSAMVSAPRPSGEFVTMLCTVLDPREHRLLYSSAGHNPPILLHNGQIQDLELGDLPLAVYPDIDYPLRQVQLAMGDTLILYTDGVTDVTNVEQELFGIKRLEDAAQRCGDRNAGEVLDAVLRTAREFGSAVSQEDDVTLLVLHRKA